MLLVKGLDPLLEAYLLYMRNVKSAFNSLSLATVVLILIAAIAVPASAAPLTVGPSEQYKTITEAVNAAQPGDTITISPGTYVENVAITKPITLRGTSPSTTTVRAANPGQDVLHLQGTGTRVEGITISGATGASGVHVDHASGFAVTGVVVRNTVRAVYLDGASNGEVSNSNLADNGYGIYCDGASHNVMTGNVAAGEQGAPPTLGDGIYMFYCDNNTVTHNNLSANHVFGISLFRSSGNTIANNSITRNEDIGTRLRESNNNTLTFNTYSGNVNAGIVPVMATGNQIYLNNFINQKNPQTGVQANDLTSPQKMTYTYNGATHSAYMSNYHSDYSGTDANGDGIGDTPSAYGEQYPLIQPFERYGTISMTGTASPTPSVSTGPIAQNVSTASVVGEQNSSALPLPGFQAWYAAVGLLVAAFVVLGLVIRKYYLSPSQTYEDQVYEDQTYEE
ncbi:MAG: right-handed parallel beta-helix repeat-containing protein [Halobacteriota archaeon]